MTGTISARRGDHLSCRQVFAYHWEAADCAGMKLAADQCLLFYGSLPGKGDQCDRGFPQWCCASTWVRWRSWGEHLGAQGYSIWKRNSGAIKHADGGMATREQISKGQHLVVEMRNESIPVPVLWCMKYWTVVLLYTRELIPPLQSFLITVTLT